jgi:isopentenyl-diphosphate delta-isomerase type 1
MPETERVIVMEFFEVVDSDGNVVGTAPRNVCHGDPSLVHRAAHVLVFNSEGKLLLQLRSKDKDIQPGKWDTSVGGHLAVGESYEEAARREMEEELGITGAELQYLYDYPLRNEIESENIRSFYMVYDGEVKHQPEEIDEVRWWDIKDVHNSLGSGIFTPNFEEEYGLYEKWRDGR